MVKHKNDEDSDSDWDSMSEAPPLKPRQPSLPLQDTSSFKPQPTSQPENRTSHENGYDTDSSVSPLPLKDPVSSPSLNSQLVLPPSRPVSGESAVSLRKSALSTSAMDSVSENVASEIVKRPVSINIVSEPLYSEVKGNSARKLKSANIFYESQDDNQTPPFDFRPALKQHESKSEKCAEPELPPKPQRIQSYEDKSACRSPEALNKMEIEIAHPDSVVGLPTNFRTCSESQGCINPGFEGSPSRSHFHKYNSSNHLTSVEICEESAETAKGSKEMPWPYEKIEIFPFEAGNVGYYQVTDKRPTICVDRVHDKSFQVATKFWAEIFGVLGLPFVIITAFVAQLLRFILVALIRPILVGLITGFSDGLVKPMLSISYNGIWQPLCILLYNMGLSVKLILTPLAEGLGLVLQAFVPLVSAFRLVDIRSAQETRLHNV